MTRISLPLSLSLFNISNETPNTLLESMHFPNKVNYIGDHIPAGLPALLVILLILNLWNFYGSIKRRIGYDEYLSPSKNEYFKIDDKVSQVVSQDNSQSESIDNRKDPPIANQVPQNEQ